jgi:hypothetical protein
MNAKLAFIDFKKYLHWLHASWVAGKAVNCNLQASGMS